MTFERRAWSRSPAALRARWTAFLLGAALVLCPTPLPARAAPEPAGSDPVPPVAMRTRVYVGMWTSHLRDPGRGLDPNSLFGVAYRGFFAATFVNSYGDRSVAAGIQRSVTRPGRSSLQPAVGYRAGLIAGYDDRLLPLAAKVPAIPFAQMVGSLDRGRVGAELAYSGITASFLLSLRL